MRARIARGLLAALAERVVQQLPSFTGDAGRLLDSRAEAHELAREVVERRLDLPPYAASVIGEEQVPGDAADDGAHDRCCDCSRVIHQASYPNKPELQVMCHQAERVDAGGEKGGRGATSAF